MRGGGEERQLQMMTRRLDLTADQQTQVKAILADRRSQMQALHARAMSIMQDSSSRIRTLLNEDQQQKFDEMQAKMRQRMQHRMGEMQGGGGDTPPPPQE
jgi:Spy/CpxP family protein refolding chaperone